MIQEIFVWLIFLMAVVYLVKIFVDQSKGKTSGCSAQGCNACSNIDFKKIEENLKKRGETVS